MRRAKAGSDGAGADAFIASSAQWVSPEGTRIACREWAPAGTAVRGGVYLLHGLGEHAGRYEALAGWLAARGWRVAAHDHYGHGRSQGARGTLPADDTFARHASVLVGRFGAALGEAPVVLGHSMGGVLAAELVIAQRLPVRALVLSSPGLDPGLNAVQRLLLALMSRLAPDLALGNGLDARRISHDPAVVAAYVGDPLVHDRVSARLVRWMLDATTRSMSAAGECETRVLMLVAGADRLVDPAGSRRLAGRLPASRLTMHWYDDGWHELFNEDAPRRLRVLADLDAWLGGLVEPLKS